VKTSAADFAVLHHPQQALAELQIEKRTRIRDFQRSFGSDVRKGGCCEMMRTSESGHQTLPDCGCAGGITHLYVGNEHPRPFFFHAAVLSLVAIQKRIPAVSYRFAPSSQIEIPAESPYCDDDLARHQNAAALVELLRRAGFDCHLVGPGRDPLPLPRGQSPVQQPRSLLSEESDADSVSERQITTDFPH
jgi:hypothetical protein